MKTKGLLVGFLSFLMVLSLMPSLALADGTVATLERDGTKVGDYTTISAALAAHANGASGTYVLTIKDSAATHEEGDLVIEQYGEKPLTIKSETKNGVTLKYKSDGTHNSNAIFNISGRSQATGRVTFEGLKFDLSGGAYSALRTMGGGSGEYDKYFPTVIGRYARNITCKNCTFIGDNTAAAHVINADAGTQPGCFLFEDCIVTNVDNFSNGYAYQTSGGETDEYGIKVKNCTVTNVCRFINNQGSNSTTIVEGCTVSSYNDYSIRTQGDNNGSVVIVKDSTITNTCPASKATVGGIIVCRNSADTVTVTNSVFNMPEGFWHVYTKGKTAKIKSGSHLVNKLEGEGKVKIGELSGDLQLTASDQGHNFVSVAQIGDKTYATLDAAIDAATGGTADKPIEIKILVDQVSFSKAPSNYTTIVGLTNEDGTPKTKITAVPATAGPLYKDSVDYSNLDSVGITFKNLIFHELGKVTVAGDYTTLDNCVFSRDSQSGTTEDNQLIRTYGKNMTFKDCTFKGEYNAFYKSYVFKDGVLLIDGCTFENLGKRDLQFMSNEGDNAKGSIYVKNSSLAGKLTIGRSYKSVVIENCSFPNANQCEAGFYPSNCTLIGCSFAPEYATAGKYVEASEGTAFIDARGCYVNGEGKLLDVFKATAGKVAVDATYDAEDNFASGFVVTTGTVTALADNCAAAKIGDNLYIVGLEASSNTDNKLTAGKYTVNPLPYVAEGYTVQPSGNQDYPYEVIKLKSGEKEKKEIVVEQKTEPVISEKIEEPAEIAVAIAVLEETKVTGVADALTDKGKDKIIQAAIDDESEVTKKIIDDARMVDVSITVEAEVIAVQTVTTKTETEKVIEFELSPYAVVTATASDGTQVSSDVIKVDNAYLAKTETKAIKVVLGSEFEPKQAVHIREDGVNEVFEKGTKASYADRTFIYDKEQKTVTLEITQFSVVKLLADEKYATVAFDANGGTGTIEAVSVEKGTKLTLPENSFKAPSGKKFKSWSIKGQTYNPGSKITVTENTTVKAEWEDGVVTADFESFWGYLMIAGFALAAIGYGLIRLGKKRRQ